MDELDVRWKIIPNTSFLWDTPLDIAHTSRPSDWQPLFPRERFEPHRTFPTSLRETCMPPGSLHNGPARANPHLVYHSPFSNRTLQAFPDSNPHRTSRLIRRRATHKFDFHLPSPPRMAYTIGEEKRSTKTGLVGKISASRLAWQHTISPRDDFGLGGTCVAGFCESCGVMAWHRVRPARARCVHSARAGPSR